jgi:hypothetical protein
MKGIANAVDNLKIWQRGKFLRRYSCAAAQV